MTELRSPPNSSPTNSQWQVRPMTRSLTAPRTLFGLGMTALSGLFVVIALVPLLAVLFYVTLQGANLLSWEVLTELVPPAGVSAGGIGNALLGTLIMVGIAALISVPIGVIAAIFLSEFGSNEPMSNWIRFATNVLSGVPSIVIGVFAYGILVVPLGTFSALAGGVALSLLMLPIVVRTAEEALKLVPDELRQASVGLGARRFQTVFGVVLPAAMPALITGVMLAIARASGESAPLLFTALFSQYWPQGLLEPTPSLAVLIYNYAIIPFAYQQNLAWTAAFILITIVLLTSIASRLTMWRR
ncbi:MAG: phosphate ABC transporter permease PstA [Leptolyngbyaceae bacterium]|nr:phosphate ABC transporter permease PstA [Leptolyngbyaceae bacterium]